VKQAAFLYHTPVPATKKPRPDRRNIESPWPAVHPDGHVDKMREAPARLHPPRRWGQNFLVNQGAADTIVLAFRPGPSDRVLEIGPGRGVLTRRLAGTVERLVAVEIDPALAGALRDDFRGDPSVEIVQGDILEVDLEALLSDPGAAPGRRARVIANLPYSIATTIVLRLIDKRRLFSDLLVLVQREVAERIASPPGRKTYGSLSVLCQSQAEVEVLLRLRPGSFRPVPKVESELVRLTLQQPDATAVPADGGAALRAWTTLLRTAFAQRRKTLLNNLARLPGPGGGTIGAAPAAALIERAGLDPRARPEEIPVAGFQALLQALRTL
jgi:16S rRNA (adenine1518-N6/adenine1519-N6)-dimethyltransferase